MLPDSWLLLDLNSLQGIRNSHRITLRPERCCHTKPIARRTAQRITPSTPAASAPHSLKGHQTAQRRWDAAGELVDPQVQLSAGHASSPRIKPCRPTSAASNQSRTTRITPSHSINHQKASNRKVKRIMSRTRNTTPCTAVTTAQRISNTFQPPHAQQRANSSEHTHTHTHIHPHLAQTGTHAAPATLTQALLGCPALTECFRTVGSHSSRTPCRTPKRTAVASHHGTRRRCGTQTIAHNSTNV
jgi:hypothetical protein